MRPIGSPKHAVFELIDNGLVVGNDIVIGRAGGRQAFRAGDLGPDIVVVFHQLDEALKIRMIGALGHIGATHMVDHNGAGQGGKEGFKLCQVGGFEIDNDGPAEFLDLVGDSDEHFWRGGIDKAFDKVEPHAANTGIVHVGQVCLVDIGPNAGHATRHPA